MSMFLKCYYGTLVFVFMSFVLSIPSLAQEDVDVIKVATYEHTLEGFAPDAAPLGTAILKAKDAYFATFSDKDTDATRDAGFAVFYTYYGKVLEKINENNDFLDSLTSHGEILAQGKKVAEQYGFHITYLGEGMFGVMDNTPYLLKTFGSSISSAWQSYFIFIKQIDSIIGDAALFISYDALRERLVLGDAIVRKYPYSKVAEMIKKTTDWMATIYVFGLDNTPVYAFDTMKLLPEVKSSYEKFLRENKNTTYYPMIDALYAFLKKDNFVFSDAYIREGNKRLREVGVDIANGEEGRM